MSIEAALAENTATMKALIVVQTSVVTNQERLLAGQQVALDKIEGAKPAAGKKPPAVKPPETPAPQTTAAAATDEVTDDQLKAEAVAWMGSKSKEERVDAATKINSILDWQGFPKGAKLTGPDSKLTGEQRQQAKFFIQRWAAGLDVNFSADYDFDGDPKQGAAAAEPDPLG